MTCISDPRRNPVMSASERGKAPERDHRPKVDPGTEICRLCGRPLHRTKIGWRHEQRQDN